MEGDWLGLAIVGGLTLFVLVAAWALANSQ